MRCSAPAACWPNTQGIQRWLEDTPASALATKMQEAELLFRRIGITFAVYTEGGDPERLIPFDIIPRILDAAEWAYLERGLEAARARAQRLPRRRLPRARDLRAGGIRATLILHNEGFRPEMQGFDAAAGVYTHIAGIDIVRTGPERLLRPRGQLPHAVGRLLHAGEPRGDDAAVSRSLSPSTASRRSRTIPRSCCETLRSVAPAELRAATRPSCC